MRHSTDNTRNHIYKLAGRQINERQTLSDIANFKTKTFDKVSNNDSASVETLGFMKKFIILGFILCLITLGLFFIAKFYGESLYSGEYSASTELYKFTIGQDKLNIPANAIRFTSDRRSGRHEKVEIYRHWPSLSGYTSQLSDDFNTPNSSDNLIFITLEKRNMMLDMSGRIAQIYGKYFLGEGKMQPYGLMQQGLSAEGGYINEDLYYAVDSPYPFATRCIKNNETSIRPFCIRDVQIGSSMMLTYRFHKKLLPQWIELDQAINAHVKSMITNL